MVTLRKVKGTSDHVNKTCLFVDIHLRENQVTLTDGVDGARLASVSDAMLLNMQSQCGTSELVVSQQKKELLVPCADLFHLYSSRCL